MNNITECKYEIGRLYNFAAAVNKVAYDINHFTFHDSLKFKSIRQEKTNDINGYYAYYWINDNLYLYNSALYISRDCAEDRFIKSVEVIISRFEKQDELNEMVRQIRTYNLLNGLTLNQPWQV